MKRLVQIGCVLLLCLLSSGQSCWAQVPTDAALELSPTDLVLRRPSEPRVIKVTDFVGPMKDGSYQYKTSDGELISLPIAPTDVPSIKKQLTLKQKHPKIYEKLHRLRRICIFAAPIISTAGAVAQIIVMFII